MKGLALLEEIEAMEDEIDLNQALKALQEIKSGKDKVVAWDDVKKEFGFILHELQ